MKMARLCSIPTGGRWTCGPGPADGGRCGDAGHIQRHPLITLNGLTAHVEESKSRRVEGEKMLTKYADLSAEIEGMVSTVIGCVVSICSPRFTFVAGLRRAPERLGVSDRQTLLSCSSSTLRLFDSST